MNTNLCDDDCYFADCLSITRTKMANERTLLAYISTSLGFLATGAGFIRFAPETVFVKVGIALFFCAGLLTACGIVRFFKVNSVINRKTCIENKTL